MSINGYGLQVSPGLLAELRSNPDRIGALLFEHGPSISGVAGLVDAVLPHLTPGFLRSWIVGRLAPGESNETKPRPDGIGSSFDIHKDWDALHYLITGTDDDEVEGPLGDVLMGGEELGEDLGYGPVRVLEPAQVAAASKALEQLGVSGILARWDPPKMRELELYGGDWDSFDKMSMKRSAGAVVAFYRSASEAGDAVLLWMA